MIIICIWLYTFFPQSDFLSNETLELLLKQNYEYQYLFLIVIEKIYYITAER